MNLGTIESRNTRSLDLNHKVHDYIVVTFSSSILESKAAAKIAFSASFIE